MTYSLNDNLASAFLHYPLVISCHLKQQEDNTLDIGVIVKNLLTIPIELLSISIPVEKWNCQFLKATKDFTYCNGMTWR